MRKKFMRKKNPMTINLSNVDKDSNNQLFASNRASKTKKTRFNNLDTRMKLGTLKPPTVKQIFSMAITKTPDSMRYVDNNAFGDTVIEDTDEDRPTKLITKDAVNFSDYVQSKGQATQHIRNKVDLK
jgi:hypothetical protein